MEGVKFLTGGRKLVSCVLIFTILLTIFSPVSTYAVTELETPNYKVAFFAFDCYHMQDENGKRTGYGYEMMQGISEFLQCTFSYVDMTNLPVNARKCCEMGKWISTQRQRKLRSVKRNLCFPHIRRSLLIPV